ncbi:MAG TPA: tetraacyldisaccharide 4'-kinase [Pyrinomonadaceae bacterium]
MRVHAPLLFPPLSALYGAIARTRLALYENGALPRYQLAAPVISVGNITTGGTGKTPVVGWLATLLAREGRRVCILTRGYGRKNPNRLVVVSDGQKIQATPDEAGDEAFLLAWKLKGSAAVISNIDRKVAADFASNKLGINTFILDDGFQHLRLRRDFDIVTVDATDPIGNGLLLPVGKLREPLNSLRRADCIILTRTEQVENSQQVAQSLSKASEGRPVFLSEMRASRFIEVNSGGPVKTLQNPVAAFCGIGNPNAFFKQLEIEGCDLVLKRIFSDHHSYKEKEIQIICNAARTHGARSLVTTEKDSVKLGSFNFDLPCYALEIEISISDEPHFHQMVRGVL